MNFQFWFGITVRCPIIHKIKNNTWEPFDKIVSPLMPYGLSTNYRGTSCKKNSDDLILHASDGISYIRTSEISKGVENIGVQGVQTR